MNVKDERILKKIISYCDQIEQACMVFGKTKECFAESLVFQNSCCMCILQIGELSGKLSEEAKMEMPDVPWRSIRGMRNICAHNYGSIDIVMTWDTIENGIPTLKERCIKAVG